MPGRAHPVALPHVGAGLRAVLGHVHAGLRAVLGHVDAGLRAVVRCVVRVGSRGVAGSVLVGVVRFCLEWAGHPAAGRVVGRIAPDAVEAALTEIPEHLLARSKARRSAMGGGDDAPTTAAPAKADAAPTPAASAAAAPVAAAAPSVPAPVAAPTPPWVEAAQTRKKIPFWAIPVLALLPLWAVIYALTLDPPTKTESPLTIGATVYSTNCATCHGATGGGSGAIPALTGSSSVVKTFPKPGDQVAWVAVGSAGWLQSGLKTLPGGRAVAGGMPAWATSLKPEEVMAVVLHERTTLDAEKYDQTKWEDGFEDALKKHVPDQAAAYKAILDSWKATPPA